jgi:hypothetical protein
MKNKAPQVINVLRPKDKSLEAYKNWLKGIASQLATDAEVQWTEEQWTEKWKKFWEEREKPQD